jgi:hypothetical protein
MDKCLVWSAETTGNARIDSNNEIRDFICEIREIRGESMGDFIFY